LTFAARGSLRRSVPAIAMRPRDGRITPHAIAIVVVLPAPLGPSRPKNSPVWISTSSSPTATCAP
jgi:hypothetical protein